MKIRRQHYYYNPTFKQIFPTWQSFHKFLLDYSVYYDKSEYSENRALIYYTLLYRQFANSNVAYDYDVFLEKLSLTVAENFREFFKIRELIEYMEDANLIDLIQGSESITNVAQNPNITTDKNTVLDYIGTQSRSRINDNLVDRISVIISKIKINEIMSEVYRYEYLFVQIPINPSYMYFDDDEEYEYGFEYGEW